MNKVIKVVKDFIGDTIQVDDLGQVTVTENDKTACVQLSRKQIKKLRKALKVALRTVKS